MKKFLISIDTEGDNQWRWKLGDSITTENSKFLPRFQELCEKFGFKPTYFTNYEMAKDTYFVKYFKDKNHNNLCEIGMHLHAWNNPPSYDLSVRKDVSPGAPYLIEYPLEVMKEKLKNLHRLLEMQFEDAMIIHRSGRWAMNDKYFHLLDELGYKMDCSVTPMINWNIAPGQSENSFGSDYSSALCTPYWVDGTNILEVPLTIRENHRLKSLKGCGIKKGLTRLKEAKRGYGPLWLRPRNNKDNLDDMLYLTDVIFKEKSTDYLMFMLHSSEFMPGGSPTFSNEEAIEKLYKNLEILFQHISKKFIGYTFKEYYDEYKHK